MGNSHTIERMKILVTGATGFIGNHLIDFLLIVLFKACKFNYRGGSLDPDEDLKGLECTAVLGVKTSDEYGDQNTIKRLVIPR